MFRLTARRLALAVTVIAAAAALAIVTLTNPAGATQPHHSLVYKDFCPRNAAHAYSPLMQSADTSSTPKK
jgi:hypothetical protein